MIYLNGKKVGAIMVDYIEVPIPDNFYIQPLEDCKISCEKLLFLKDNGITYSLDNGDTWNEVDFSTETGMTLVNQRKFYKYNKFMLLIPNGWFTRNNKDKETLELVVKDMHNSSNTNTAQRIKSDSNYVYYLVDYTHIVNNGESDPLNQQFLVEPLGMGGLYDVNNLKNNFSLREYGVRILDDYGYRAELDWDGNYSNESVELEALIYKDIQVNSNQRLFLDVLTVYNNEAVSGANDFSSLFCSIDVQFKVGGKLNKIAKTGKGLFANCKKLIDASKLNLKTIAYCANMFRGCTSLVNAPKLPATTLAERCYLYMFTGCTSLVNAPELPATTLAYCCYFNMFGDCTSLVNAPELPATTLADSCYLDMFYGCTNLKYIKALFLTSPSASMDGPTTYWVANVSPTGTFIKNKDATWNLTGANGIPSGWTIETA